MKLTNLQKESAEIVEKRLSLSDCQKLSHKSNGNIILKIGQKLEFAYIIDSHGNRERISKTRFESICHEYN